MGSKLIEAPSSPSHDLVQGIADMFCSRARDNTIGRVFVGEEWRGL